MAHLCPELPEHYLKGLLELKSMGAVVMVVALKHQLSEEGFYWFNLPKEAGFPMLALVEHTNFVPADKFGGDRIVYAGDYLVPGHEYFSLSDSELLERFAPTFKRINPAFELDWVRKVWVSKTNYAQPVPLVDHSKNIPSIETPAGRVLLDEPGLPLGPGDQLRGGDRAQGGQPDDEPGALTSRRSDVNSAFSPVGAGLCHPAARGGAPARRDLAVDRGLSAGGRPAHCRVSLS
jgi:hypothetical protein